MPGSSTNHARVPSPKPPTRLILRTFPLISVSKGFIERESMQLQMDGARIHAE